MSEIGRNPAGMPAPNAVESECQRMGLSRDDAAYLIDHWRSNGFRVGRNKVKDWRAVLRTWKTNQWFPSQKTAKDTSKKTDWSKFKVKNDGRNLF